ncbi:MULTISPECIES: MFS transporter [Prauserella salsuginis group]|uniref:Sugar phosphate permease n=2 Tax=Prauserella salsuginis group TaxID=2893672 RepID=A0A839XJP6_9PSEU|nr:MULTISPECIES: MFS transporter [Prauserella salsuginis group]MBB3661989.1 sugar phosphate permease [Prauserella sediminis]MCR3719688.1 Sugar phosphate permease [Prauserella flava]MCR3736769.1 Sugar phosphate permease [Prauserella salsuginis]
MTRVGPPSDGGDSRGAGDGNHGDQAGAVGTDATTATGRGAGWFRWRILALGLSAQTASCAFLFGIPFLVPAMQQAENLTLSQAGTVVVAPSIGLLLTLILWGAAADRYGERLVMALGLGASGVLLLAVGFTAPSLPVLFALLVAAGACTASVNAASGRVVMGWFSADERGVAMGIRQTAQPIGVGIAALSLPALAEQGGYRGAMLLPAVLALVVAMLVAWLVVDPPRPESDPTRPDRPRSPYRGPTLWRVHGASALLVVPQFAVSAFAPVYLVTMHDWSALAAGAFLAVGQGLGALGRLVAGYWSDRVHSRLRPMRTLALASAMVMLLLAGGDATWSWLAVGALTLAAVVTVSDNGLGFTASAELAGLSWAGRAMGVQNTTQNLAAVLTPPLLGLVIGDGSYALGFCVAAIFPVLAIWLTPVRSER